MLSLRRQTRPTVPRRLPFSVLAPGRVNLIGEHIDYSQLSVFPMAIQRRVRLRVEPRRDNHVHVRNADTSFGEVGFAIGADIEAQPNASWGNYLRAPIQALARAFPQRVHWRGFDAELSSDLPAAAGLSSSSALVIAMGLALIETNAIEIDPLNLADIMALAEQYVGVRGGGMDQAICMGGTKGCASRVDFGPLRLTPTRVPTNWVFVVAHSLVSAHKAGAARVGYNRRTVECRRALLTVWPALPVRCRIEPPLAGRTIDVERQPSYRDLLPLDPDEVLRVGRAQLDATLFSRFRHTVSEAARVYAAEQAMRADDIGAFGRTMCDSHASLRDDFGVSSPELDRLSELAVAAGATGARLTGAGFGGCVIALCHADHVEHMMQSLRRDYYASRSSSLPIDDALFVVEASHGARTMRDAE